VKAGFAGVAADVRVASLLAAAIDGASASRTDVVAVAYADYDVTGTVSPEALLTIAIQSGARGVLLDTAAKDGPSLAQLVAPGRLEEWVQRARSAGLSVALAGRVTPPDLPLVAAAGADIVGVRGAACEGGRDGEISVERIRRLRAVLRAVPRHTLPMAALAVVSGEIPDQR
jgi:uncharacterized protein (UPF0264 family)